MSFQELQIIPLIVAGILSIHGLRRRSLSPSGALAAFITGFTMLSVPLRSFGILTIAFYLIGSRATKLGKVIKARLEEGHQDAGYRTASQVLCNSFTALTASVMWSASFIDGSVAASLLPEVLVIRGPSYDPDIWCPVSRDVSAGWSRMLVLLTLGHFSCCLGDTLASELGILSSSPPILVTTFKPVPPGTNGGMSAMGTIASLLGGFAMGLTLIITLAIENPACRRAWSTDLLPFILFGTAAGGLGSLIDSFMGSTIQETRQSSETRRIIPDDSRISPVSYQVISGYDILTNNQVNLLSSAITACLLARFA